MKNKGLIINITFFIIAITTITTIYLSPLKGIIQMNNYSKIQFDISTKRVSENEIIANYNVKNISQKPIYLFNILFKTDREGNRALDPGLAYSFKNKENRIIFGKYLIKIPDGIKVEKPEFPYLDCIQPDKTISGNFHVTNPFYVVLPYHNEMNTKVIKNAEQITFLIGFLDSSKFLKNEAVISDAYGAGKGHYNCSYGLALQYQEFIEKTINVKWGKVK